MQVQDKEVKIDMIIRNCDYGHIYDAEYFDACPHCKKENKKSKKSVNHKKDKESTPIYEEHQIENAINQVKTIMEDDPTPEIKTRKEIKEELVDIIVMASMPSTITKNQEFCLDLCISDEEKWQTGAEMLKFKSQNASRDIKTMKLPIDTNLKLSICYKEEILKDISLDLSESRNRILTYPMVISDNRDRRLHMLKLVFKEMKYEISETLILQPTL